MRLEQVALKYQLIKLGIQTILFLSLAASHLTTIYRLPDGQAANLINQVFNGASITIVSLATVASVVVGWLLLSYLYQIKLIMYGKPEEISARANTAKRQLLLLSIFIIMSVTLMIVTQVLFMTIEPNYGSYAAWVALLFLQYQNYKVEKLQKESSQAWL